MAMDIGIDVGSLSARIEDSSTTQNNSLMVQNVGSCNANHVDCEYHADYDRKGNSDTFVLDETNLYVNCKSADNNIKSRIIKQYAVKLRSTKGQFEGRTRYDPIKKYTGFMVHMKPFHKDDYYRSRDGNINTVTFYVKKTRQSLDACQGDLGGGMNEVDQDLAENDARQRPHAEKATENSLPAFADWAAWPWNWSWFQGNSKQSEQEQADNKPSVLGKTRSQTKQKAKGILSQP